MLNKPIFKFQKEAIEEELEEFFSNKLTQLEKHTLKAQIGAKRALKIKDNKVYVMFTKKRIDNNWRQVEKTVEEVQKEKKLLDSIAIEFLKSQDVRVEAIVVGKES